MNPPKTNTDRAVEYIAAHPGCRTPEIEAAVKIANCSALLKPLVDAGFLLACKVDRPNTRPSYEYRLGASVTPNMTWAEFRGATAAKKRGLTVTTRPMRTANPTPIASKATQPLDPTTEEKPISHPPAVTVQTLEMGAPHPGIAPPLMRNDATNESGGSPTTTEKPKLYFSLDSNGRLHISIGGEYLDLAPEAVRKLGRFMIGTEAAWA